MQLNVKTHYLNCIVTRLGIFLEINIRYYLTKEQDKLKNSSEFFALFDLLASGSGTDNVGFAFLH